MRKFNIGDTVRVIERFCEHNVGKVAVIDRYDPYDCKLTYGFENYGGWISAEYIELIDDTSARLTEAEAKIAALEAEVAALKQAGEVEKVSFRIASADADLYIRPKSGGEVWYRNVRASNFYINKTPNQRRADVIKRAQAFVADLEERAIGRSSNTDGNPTFKYKRTKLTFHVNAEKGVVTALAKHLGENRVDKAFAKCHPNDVFNADIGKAIAAGKLYGVDIPQEFVDAPKPTEIVVGMRVKGNSSGSTYEVTRFLSEEKLNGRFGRAFFARGFRGSDWCGTKQVTINDDTDAVYS